jgi:hypothetical protein
MLVTAAAHRRRFKRQHQLAQVGLAGQREPVLRWRGPRVGSVGKSRCCGSSRRRLLALSSCCMLSGKLRLLLLHDLGVGWALLHHKAGVGEWHAGHWVHAVQRQPAQAGDARAQGSSVHACWQAEQRLLIYCAACPCCSLLHLLRVPDQFGQHGRQHVQLLLISRQRRHLHLQTQGKEAAMLWLDVGAQAMVAQPASGGGNLGSRRWLALSMKSLRNGCTSSCRRRLIGRPCSNICRLTPLDSCSTPCRLQ